MGIITITDFKSFFLRNFPYLPYFDATKAYKKDAVAYDSLTDIFYISLKDNNTSALTVTTDWSQSSDDQLDYVTDDDITKAFSECEINFNQGLFNTPDRQKIGYLYLTAHNLCMDLRAALGGFQSSGDAIVSSKSVGSVSESYTIPELYNKPAFSFYITSQFGVKYLQLAYPATMGVFSATGGANP